MKKFIIYFEVFSRKMRIEIEANSEVEAKKILQDRIIFHKIEEVPKNELNDLFESFKNIFGNL